jgi:hypothetical protein
LLAILCIGNRIDHGNAGLWKKEKRESNNGKRRHRK